MSLLQYMRKLHNFNVSPLRRLKFSGTFRCIEGVSNLLLFASKYGPLYGLKMLMVGRTT